MKLGHFFDAEPVTVLDISNIEIVIDDDYPERVELYKLDSNGLRLEGGTFSKDAFMAWIDKFYSDNY